MKKEINHGITKIEAVNQKERIFVTNGVKFYCGINSAGFRILTACHESKRTLESALRMLITKGWDGKVKRPSADKSLWLLEAKEKRPSGPWPDEEPKLKQPCEHKNVNYSYPSSCADCGAVLDDPIKPVEMKDLSPERQALALSFFRD